MIKTAQAGCLGQILCPLSDTVHQDSQMPSHELLVFHSELQILSADIATILETLLKDKVGSGLSDASHI